MRYLRKIPLFVVMGGIFLISHQPGDSIVLPDIPDIDKLLHCLEYAILAIAALFAFSPQARREQPVIIRISIILFCLLYAISDEFHQSFIPGRFPSSWDVLADTVGGIIAVKLWYRFVEPRI